MKVVDKQTITKNNVVTHINVIIEKRLLAKYEQ